MGMILRFFLALLSIMGIIGSSHSQDIANWQSLYSAKAEKLYDAFQFDKMDSLLIFTKANNLTKFYANDFKNIFANSVQLEKIEIRINSIDKNNLLLSNYCTFLEDAIATQCFRIQLRLLTSFTNKWRELLLDNKALKEISDLREIDEKAKSLNQIVLQIKNEIDFISNSTGFFIDTQIDEQNPEKIKQCFQKFKEVSQSFNNINFLVNKYKSTKNKYL